MPQITLHKPDNSKAEAFFISQTLYDELARVATILELIKINLSILPGIEIRVLSACSEKPLNTSNLGIAFFYASHYFNWFIELLALIEAVEKLPNSHSLSICF